MAKIQQRFAVDDEDQVISDWIGAQKNLSMSVHVLIQDYVNRFGSTDAYAAVLSRGLGPATEQHSAPNAPTAPSSKRDSVKKTQKAATADPEKAPLVLNEDKSVPDRAEASTTAASSDSFNFGR